MLSDHQRGTLSSPVNNQKAESAQRNKIMERGRRISRRERKLALQQDVDKLKKKLIYEENVHRALKRAFTRPLGSLPRLPPYLPPNTLELLAEVAVLEEEVVRLEEQVVVFRQDLYQETVAISSSKRNSDCLLYETSPKPSTKREEAEKIDSIEQYTVVPAGDEKGKENHKCTNLTKSKQKLIKGKQIPSPVTYKTSQPEPRSNNTENAVMNALPQDQHSPNAISEKLVKGLVTILMRMRRTKSRSTADQLPSLVSLHGSQEFQDPYGICLDRRRDIGTYKNLCSIDSSSLNPNRKSSCVFLLRRIKILLERLASVNLHGLTHQRKLAFWINVYNSCIMNAFIEDGVPESPETVVALLQKASINVGGHILNAITIEHSMLRLPNRSNDMNAPNVVGLEVSEPLVNFALSYGTRSSPAVRVYTAPQVEQELEEAKRDYLQASIAITKSGKIIIPEVLSWYLNSIVKDFESDLDWISLELPLELRKEAIKCLERGKCKRVQVAPFEFSFRYLFFTN